ncbi:MAG: NUDIX hydrolase [Sphingomonadaceae bacterium]|nr:NUDIX hydrolase [Sphingomonadaceae bacterium]
MSPTAADPAIAAATVVLLREGAAGGDGTWQLLLLERHAATAFAGGAMVFPGGRVDPGDAAVAADPALAEGFALLDPTDAAARVAAAREAFEEAGVILGHGAGGDTAATERAVWRARINARTATWAEFLRATGTRLDAALLLPFAHWVPPAAAPIARRFDTLFYLARLPAGAEVSPDGGEAVTAHWTTPAAAVARADAGEIGLVFPTRRNLERLAQYLTLDALWSATAAREVTRIQPAIVDRDGTPWITIPEDCDYPVTAEPLASLRRE